MTVEGVTGLMGRRFRAGTSFDLVVFDRLPPREQALLDELRRDKDFYGVLRPRSESGRTLKAVNRDTALLWLTLQTPGPLPFFVFSGDSESAVGAICELVLDGVLEVESDGRFVAGPEASGVLPRTHRVTPQGRLSRLSRAALLYGERLQLESSQLLAARLYGFGRQPVSPLWARRLPNEGAVLEFLAGPSGSSGRRRLDTEWTVMAGRETRGWVAWSSTTREDTGVGGMTYKLYVSPDIEALPHCLDVVLDVLGQRAARFKVGANAAGLLRPDKMVLYFTDQEKLLRAASDLGGQLSAVDPHGVPFSAEITPGGLLSWGIDPPRRTRMVAWQEPESWRLWVARRLAAAMVAAQKSSPSELSPSEFALERLRHEGVDVETWTPAANIWQAE
jgi:hypothetical protein